jgi:hypothetical protein
MRRFVTVAATFWLISHTLPAVAADVEVDLELVLAVDVSRSMDFDEQQLQRNGYIEAFQHPEVIQAIQSGSLGRIAVTYFEWAGPGFQRPVAPWALIANAKDADDFALNLGEAPISREIGTSISSGLFFAVGRFNDNGFTSYRRAIDVSGDGPNNDGRPVELARDFVVSRGITINGLPIMLKPNLRYTPYGIPNLDIYYEDCVIGGPGAFMIAVRDPADFEAAIRRKLVMEIAGLPARVMPAAEIVRPPRIDCMIGEKTRRNIDNFR